MNSLVTGGLFADFIQSGIISNIKAKIKVTLDGCAVTAVSESESLNVISSYDWKVFLNSVQIISGTNNNLMFAITDNGTYTISLTVTDEINNSDSISSDIVFNEEISHNLSGTGFSGGMVQHFPKIHLNKIEEEYYDIKIVFLGEL